MSRRTLLKGAGVGAFTLASLAVLPRFSTPDRKQDPAACFAPDVSGSDPRFVISNWPEYIDEDDGDVKSSMTLFSERYGIDVSYVADVNDNAEFFAKVVNQLGTCQSTGRDMFVLTDWLAARMIQMGWIQKLDKAAVPNLDRNLLSSLRGADWDPGRDYSAPWQSGFTGIAYNKAKVKEVRTFDELLTRPDLRGRVSLLTEMRDTMGLALLSDGKDPSRFTDGDWDAAIDKIREARGRGQIRSFTGNEYINDLAAGNIVACTAWSGDVAAAEDENIVFVRPDEGMMIWSDNMLVPNLATHQANAQKWIDHYYDPAVAARLAAYVWYVCPVEGAQREMEKIDGSLVDNPLIFPTDDYLRATHQFMALQEFQIRQYEGDYADVSGG
ncbi:spermidine/putrescine transport system substrate-binding protein [Isoptericola jiangsuensis]|uniref:Spermidine/putrescine transport system substrate-binding protein n=1 Tax=Isoptericola jiangsuensis TaxID=548579 RepID=A0A2A9EYS5_9MICO|nr:spermidine/putrescine ABC transporter substrate-binding protein [Isoptericola jiangsuensis]PFG43462.1 spermidine/putrescine transport system substrate-binding protein [Isoptericola jiangsuensis]